MLCIRTNPIEQLMSDVLLFSSSSDFRNKKKNTGANEGWKCIQTMKCSVIKMTLISVKLEEKKDVFHVPCRVCIYWMFWINYFIQKAYKKVRLKKFWYAYNVIVSDSFLTISVLFIQFSSAIRRKKKISFARLNICCRVHILTNWHMLVCDILWGKKKKSSWVLNISRNSWKETCWK